MNFTAAKEIVGGDDLTALLEQKARKPTAYIGFEPSGTAHVGWMVCTQTIQELQAAGFGVTILLADWHAQINDKLGGNMDDIRRCGEYMIDAFEALGVPRNSVKYAWASEFAADPKYWEMVIKVAKNCTLARVRRAMDIMGRTADEAEKDLSKFLYPAMQVADIFYMKVDLAYGGMDQRHAHMLARDIAKKMGYPSPIALHTALVPSLKGGQGRMDPVEIKMSKSDPTSGIFLHDTPDVVQKKINKAHCPAEIEDNPVFELLKWVIWPRLDGEFVINRPEKFGGNLQFATIEAVAEAYASETLHAIDLKNGVVAGMNAILAPVLSYFEKNSANWKFVEELRRTR